MNDRLRLGIARAVAEGLLPEDAAAAHDARPWPVVLLTALGAWLAAIPLLFALGLLMGDMFRTDLGMPVIGALIAAGAVAVLRSSGALLFVEQLAVPVLAVGLCSLGYGLMRHGTGALGAAVLAMVTLGAAAAIPQAWLRVVLGAAAAALLTFSTGSSLALHLQLAEQECFWLALQAMLLIAVAASWMQVFVLADGRRARAAATLEPVLVGWQLLLLCGLAIFSGKTFLIDGALGNNFTGVIAGEVTRGLGHTVLLRSMQGGSVLAALLAIAVGARAWPSLRKPSLLVVAIVPVTLAWFLPSLGAVLFMLAAAVTTQRFSLAGAAALAAAWIIGSFYYQLGWPLADKAMVLVAAGALLGLVAWLGHPRMTVPSRKVMGASDGNRRAPWLVVIGGVLTLAVLNIAIWQKESIIAHGKPVFVALTPVDPRSLMQGDYMALNFRLPLDNDVGDKLLAAGDRAYVIAQSDARGVARLLRIGRKDAVLGPGEFRMALKPGNGRWMLVTDAWHFKEGDAQRWATARFGEFRVDADGNALLVGMANAELQAIQP